MFKSSLMALFGFFIFACHACDLTQLEKNISTHTQSFLQLQENPFFPECALDANGSLKQWEAYRDERKLRVAWAEKAQQAKNDPQLITFLDKLTTLKENVSQLRISLLDITDQSEKYISAKKRIRNLEVLLAYIRSEIL